MSRPSFNRIRPSFERLENREVFSAGPLTSELQIPTDNDVMISAAAEPSAFVSQLEFEMLSPRSASQSHAVPTGTIQFVRNETAAAHDAVFTALGMQTAPESGPLAARYGKDDLYSIFVAAHQSHPSAIGPHIANYSGSLKVAPESQPPAALPLEERLQGPFAVVAESEPPAAPAILTHEFGHMVVAPQSGPTAVNGCKWDLSELDASTAQSPLMTSGAGQGRWIDWLNRF